MGRVPFKGWLLLMLGASRAPLSAEEARAMRKPRGKSGGPGNAEPRAVTTTVVLPPRAASEPPPPDEAR